ncbi:MAG TPA: hypothetical protein VIU44_15285, partial [Gaiellaceae bacterium]
GSISLDANGNFTTADTLSTIEIVNIMLGAGNDTLTIGSTLQPGGDFNPITGVRGELAHHGGITAVHGGGNALLDVDGSFDISAGQVVRTDGLSWQRYGFVAGQEITLPNGNSYTVTGFGTGTYGDGDTMYLAGGPTLPAVTQTISGLLAVSDYLAVTSTFQLSGNGILLSNGQAWQSLGFLVGRQVYVPGQGVFTITGYANSAAANADGLPGDGAILLVAGSLPAVQLTGTISVTSRYHLNGTLTLTGTSDGGTLVLPAGSAASSGLVVGQQVWVAGVNGTRTIAAISGDTLTLTGGPIAPSATGTFAVTSPTSITRATGSWTGSGFTAGQQVTLGGGLSGTYTVFSVTATTLTLTGSALAVIPSVNATVTVTTPLVRTGTVAAVRVGGDSITLTGPSYAGSATTTSTSISRTDGGSFVTDGFAIGQQVILGGGLGGVYTITGVVETKVGNVVTSSTLQLGGGTLGTPGGAFTITVLPIGAGPGQPYDNYAPLVIYGDTSQDGVWYGGDPHTQSLHNFGPKPMPHIEGAVVTLARSADGFTGYINLISSPSNDFRTDGFAVGNELALGPDGALTSPAVSAAGVVYDI